MLFRFSLYGFLKNQRYFEPFLALALLEKGLTFGQIGLLIGLRELCTNLSEVPSGAIADLYGRRRSMVAAFASYIASFVLFAIGDAFTTFAGAMVLFGIGDAFRSGTHKAMIFEWLRAEGREAENTRVYGYTRSWSKLGSALSSLLAAGMVFYTGQYIDIFWFALVPYSLNLVNLATYPRALDGPEKNRGGIKAVWRKTWDTTRRISAGGPLRRLVVESMGFEGVYAAVKDYLQPILFMLALSIPVWMHLEDDRRAALVVGAVYFVLYILSSLASRRAHRLSDRCGGAESSARVLWWGAALSFVALLPLLYFGIHIAGAAGFVALAVLQNLWRPILVSRIDRHSEADSGATILSVEAQAKSIATMIMAPALGLAVDAINVGAAASEREFWPVAALGVAVTFVMLISRSRTKAAPMVP